MIPVQIRFTRRIIEHIDRLVESGMYSNRSEAIRDATRRLVTHMGSNGSSFPDTLNNNLNNNSNNTNNTNNSQNSTRNNNFPDIDRTERAKTRTTGNFALRE